MTYVSPDFTTKKALMFVVNERKKESDVVTEVHVHVSVYEPGIGTVPRDGPVYLEGPHSPRSHTWYATGTMKDGKLIAVR